MEKVLTETAQNELMKNAFALGIFTVVYNVIEGVVSIYFGVTDDALTLFGFGADSFIESISATGVCYMLYRMRRNPNSEKSQFEITALKITAWCFYALAAILAVSAVLTVIEGREPETTLPGVVISSISIAVMIWLIRAKKRIGRKLDSQAIVADANCNLVCVYMSLVLLTASGLYLLFEIPYIDVAGTAVIIYFCIKEGKESFEKAKGIECSDCEDD